MYRKDKLNINVFYKDDGYDILDVLKQDFKAFFDDYIRENFY